MSTQQEATAAGAGIVLPAALRRFTENAERAGLSIKVEQQEAAADRSHQIWLEVFNPSDALGAYLYMIAQRGGSGRWNVTAHYAPSTASPLHRISQRDAHLRIRLSG